MCIEQDALIIIAMVLFGIAGAGIEYLVTEWIRRTKG